MPDLLSYLVPNRINSTLVRAALSYGDMAAIKFRASLPDDVRAAWHEQLRPALTRWAITLEQEENR